MAAVIFQILGVRRFVVLGMRHIAGDGLGRRFGNTAGIGYPMRMQDMGTFGFVSELGPAAYPTFPFDPEDFVDPEIV